MLARSSGAVVSRLQVVASKRVAPLVRHNRLSTTSRLWNANKIVSEKESELPPRPKKPLSRIPLGTSAEAQHQNAGNGNTVEFSTWKAAVLFVATGSVLYYVFNREKKRLETEREAEANRGYGKPVLGGPFELVDFNGNKFTEKDLQGKWSILYFGFTHCPDICPDELDKLGVWLKELSTNRKIELQPIFITCDPARDSPKVMKEYLADFYPGIIGLTGTYEQVKQACKRYRVYFSTPPNVKPGQDYLVDHSVFFYLMDPEGEFVDVLGLNYDEIKGPDKIEEHVKAFVPKAEREKRDQKWYSFLFK